MQKQEVHKTSFGDLIIINNNKNMSKSNMSHKLRLGSHDNNNKKQSKSNISHKLRLGAIIIRNGANTICLPNFSWGA
jgi:hypothetical protein